MPRQSEQKLEKTLIEQLNKLGFLSVVIEDNDALIINLRTQLEKFNQASFSDAEFKRILNYLNKGDRFQKAKTLRDRFLLKRDDETTKHIRFFNMEQWCKNEYQVTNQIIQTGRYENRYDVTLLINGLPLVHIELKRRGVEMKEAFNQIQPYQYYAVKAIEKRVSESNHFLRKRRFLDLPELRYLLTTAKENSTPFSLFQALKN